MRRIAFLTTLLIALCVASTSAVPTIEWVKAFDGIADPYSIQQTEDGGYVVSGELLLKTSANGAEEWRSQATSSLVGDYSSVCQASNGDYIIAGSTDRGYCDGGGKVGLVRTTSAGVREWAKAFELDLGHLELGLPLHCSSSGFVYEQSDGGIMVLVGTLSGDASLPLSEIVGIWSQTAVKTDSTGMKLWEHTLSWDVNLSLCYVYGFEEAANGDLIYFILGELVTVPGSTAYTLALDATSGAELGRAAIGENGYFPEYLLTGGNALLQDGHGNTIEVVTTSSGQAAGVDLIVSSYASLEDVNWTVQVERPGDQWAVGIQQTSDGGFIVLGAEETPSGDTTTLLVKLSADNDPPSTHSVSTPHQPSGPTTGAVAEDLMFLTYGSTCSQGHSLQYRYDWDDEEVSEWSSGANASHSYEREGSYEVRAQARCADQTTITSDWSVPLQVSVENSSVLGPIANAGPDREYRDSNGDGIESISLDGSSSLGQDNEIVSYRWSTGGQVVASLAQPLIELGHGEHTITLTVEDENGLSDVDVVIVTVLPSNGEPSEDDVEALARIIISEASVGNYIERQCVGWTVINRLNADHYYGEDINLETVQDVVYPGGKWGPQYSYNQEPTEYYRDLARELLQGEISDPTKGCTNLFSPRGAKELDDTAGKDISGGLFRIPEPTSDAWDDSLLVYFPGWGANAEMSGSNIYFSNDSEHETYDWIEIEGVEHNNYFMFYRPRISKLSAKIGSPGELRAVDSQGRVTGLVEGRVMTDIPGSSYSDEGIVIHNPAGKIYFEVVGTESGSYSLFLEADAGNRSFTATSLPITEGVVHRFSVLWLQVGRMSGVTLSIDNDGDGDFEQFLEVGETLDGGQLVTPPVALPAAGEIMCGPNPVDGSGTAFFYSLPMGIANSGIKVFNITGQLVFETAIDPDFSCFPATGRWMPVDLGGIPLANGPYVYVLFADGRVIAQGKMVIQR